MRFYGKQELRILVVDDDRELLDNWTPRLWIRARTRSSSSRMEKGLHT